MKKLILATFSFLALVGCGIKGDPLPPFETQTVQKNPDTAVKKEGPIPPGDTTKIPDSSTTSTKKKTQ